MRKFLLSGVICLCGFVCSVRAQNPSVSGDWKPVVPGAEVTNASSWSTGANWAAGVIPQTSDALAYFTNALAGTEYVLLPDELTLGALDNKSAYRCFIGGRLNLVSGTFTSPFPAGRIRDLNDRTRIYADIHVPYGFSGAFAACGRVIQTNRSDLGLTFSIGTISHRADLYAYSPDPNRDSEFLVNNFYMGTGQLYLYAPRGSGGETGAWAQTAGSPYLFHVSGKKGYSLPVGTVVTGEGLPEGTFLKRIFSDTAIELSSPAAATVASNMLSFAAITPNVRQVCKTFNKWSDNQPLLLAKYREQDIFRFEVPTLTSQTADPIVTLTTESGCYPGTFVLHNTQAFKCKLRFQSAHVEFAESGSASVTSGLPNAAFVDFSAASSTARISVTNGIAAWIPVLTNFVGTLTKDGAGSLTIGFAGTNNNAAVIREGTLAVFPCDAGAATVLQSLSVSNSAVFMLQAGKSLTLTGGMVAPGGVLEVGEGAELTLLSPVSLAPGAILRGPGTVIVQAASTATGAVQQDGVTVRSPAVPGQPAESGVPEGLVVGHPAFWIDAAAENSITINGFGLITRLNDCRAGEPIFATNVVNAPTYLPGMVNGKPCIVMGRTNRWTHGFADGEGLVWSVPVEGIRAVFTVIVPNGYAYQDGGGCLLGCTPRLATSWFFCEQWGTWNAPIFTNATPALVRTAPLYINGAPWKYGDGFMQQQIPLVIESHPFAPGAASDAFGYDRAGGAYSGCQTLCETIVYTNELTQSERLQIAQYLARKWCARDISVTSRFAEQQKLGEYTLTGSSAFEVPEGSSLGVTMLAGSGELVKTGSGTLYLDGSSATGAAVRVSAGAAVIRSAAVPSFADLPSGTYLHVDAAQTNTMTVQDYAGYGSLVTTNMVLAWRDCRGGNVYATPRVYTDNDYRGGVLVTNSLNGLPVVDYGPLAVNAPSTKDKHFHEFHTAASMESQAENVQSAFVVIGSQYGGNSVLGGVNSAYGIARAISADYTRPIVSSSAAAPFKFLRAWVNGASVEARSTGLSGGYDVVSFAADCPGFKVSAFADYNAQQYCGGQQLGEAILYTNQLAWDEHAKVDAYLNAKWFNRSSAYYSPAVIGGLTVDDGAALTVTGGVPLTVASSLRGAGLITGAVAMGEQAVFEVTVSEDGTITPLVINGSFTFEHGATVRLIGAVNKLGKGDYTLVSCDGLAAGQPGTWTVVGGSDRFTYAVGVQDGALVLHVLNPGTILMFY